MGRKKSTATHKRATDGFFRSTKTTDIAKVIFANTMILTRLELNISITDCEKIIDFLSFLFS
jgi:hypothetical protein